MRATVLVGFAEALAAPEVVWSLVDQQFEVIAFARRGQRCALRHSRHVTCYEITPPNENAEASLFELRELMRARRTQEKEGDHVLLPLDDNAIWLSDRMLGEPGWIMAGPCGRHAALALDKQAQLEAARAAGFQVTSTMVATEADEIPADTPMPLILRPSKAVWESGDHLEKGGLWVCETRAELEAAFEAVEGTVPFLVQPYIIGKGEGIFGLAMPDGEVKAWSGHRRVRMMNPHGSGSSACMSQPISEDLRAAAERLIRNTGWEGMFMVELLRDRQGVPWFVEFNGRAWGSMALARRQGYEYPFWHVMLTVNPETPLPTLPSEESHRLCRHMGRELMHVLFVLRGPRFGAVREWPSFWQTLKNVLSFRRRDYFYNWRRDDLKVFLADCYLTIHNNVFKSRK